MGVGGTGIGLGLVRSIAQLMDGRAYAESEVGKGSHFYFEFPKKEVATIPVPFVQPTEVVELNPIYEIGTDFRILVVEDNLDMQQYVKELLGKRYKEVILAGNGVEGLEVLNTRGHEIDLIVSDIMMPEMDGLSMLKEIKGRTDWQGIPVIMLTALAEERSKLSALTIGVDDYLTKPFSVPELEARVQNLLYHSHQRRSWQEEHVKEPSSGETVSLKLTAADKAWIEGLEQLVLSSLAESRLNAEELAEKANMSGRNLRRKLKQTTGLTSAKFIKEIQLREARKELEEGMVISIADVAFKYGFEHQATFSTVFKARFGKSPKEYLRAG